MVPQPLFRPDDLAIVLLTAEYSCDGWLGSALSELAWHPNTSHS
jgi:hypothetical protein